MALASLLDDQVLIIGATATPGAMLSKAPCRRRGHLRRLDEDHLLGFVSDDGLLTMQPRGGQPV